MLLSVVRFIAILLVALGLTMGAAHALEMPVKLQYDAELYMSVTSTLYRFFGIIGAIVQMGSLVVVGLLCWLTWRRASRAAFGWTLAALIALVVSLALWALIVPPVNIQWDHVLQSDPSAAPDLYIRLRPRWEYGHAAAFVAWLAGFACLVMSVLTEIPRHPRGTSSV
jgi:hypothetical protein